MRRRFCSPSAAAVARRPGDRGRACRRRDRPLAGARLRPAPAAGQVRGRAARPGAGAARAESACCRRPGAAPTTRASPTPCPTTSPPPRRPPRAVRPNDPGTLNGAAGALGRRRAGSASSGTSSPRKARERRDADLARAGSTRSAPGATCRSRPPGRRGRRRRRARHRHRLPLPGQPLPPQPRLRRRASSSTATTSSPTTALPLDENGHGTHVAGTIGEKTNNGIGADRARLPRQADAGAGARPPRPRPAPTTSPGASASRPTTTPT